MARTRDLDEGALAAIRALVDLAFAGDFDDHDWAHALGGVHALIEIDGATVGHASVVPRSFWLDDQPLRCGYVEAVAVHPHHRRRGLGWRLMGAMEALIAGTDDLGALSSETKLIAHLPFLERLRDLGRARAQRWLAEHGAKVGHACSVDLAARFAPPGGAA